MFHSSASEEENLLDKMLISLMMGGGVCQPLEQLELFLFTKSHCVEHDDYVDWGVGVGPTITESQDQCPVCINSAVLSNLFSHTGPGPGLSSV